MLKKYKVFTLLFLVLSWNAYSHDIHKISLTEKEEAFLESNPVIYIGAEESWSPLVIKNKNGSLSGFDVDILAAINQISGANFKLQTGIWNKLKTQAIKGKITGLSSGAELGTSLLKSDPYFKFQDIIFTREGHSAHYHSINDFKGLTFAVQKGNLHTLTATQKIKGISIVTFDTFTELIEAVTTGKADAMIGNVSTRYHLISLNNPFLEPAFYLKNKPMNLVFLINKERAEAISIINKSLANMSITTIRNIEKKWFFNSPFEKNKIVLTSIEKKYLKNKKQISLCVDPNWMPFEKIENNRIVGMTSHLFKLIESEIGTPLKLTPSANWKESVESFENNECDILTLAAISPERAKQFNFTQSYLSPVVVVVSKNSSTSTSKGTLLSGERLGIVKGYVYYNYIKEHYPELKLIEVTSAEDGIKRILADEIDGYVDVFPVIGHLLQEKASNELVISGKIDMQWELASAVSKNNPILLSILNKAISNIPDTTKHNIFNKSFSLKYQEHFDYWLLVKLFFVMIVITLVLNYRNRLIRKHNIAMQAKIEIIDANILMVITNLKAEIIDASSAFCKKTGFKKSDLIGMHARHLDYDHKKNDKEKEVRSAIINKGQWKSEIKTINASGSFFWTELTVIDSSTIQKHYSGFHLIYTDITNKKLIEKISQTDTLTNLNNRLRLDKKFKYEFLRTERYQSPFTIIILDIDFFKLVNDQYGHQAGDQVLIELSQILTKTVREIDTLGRWGGEEFLILCPETSLQGAFTLAEKIRKSVEENNFTDVNRITCSLGVTHYKNGDNLNDMFNRADRALFQAKKEGRNKIVFYD